MEMAEVKGWRSEKQRSGGDERGTSEKDSRFAKDDK